MTEPTRLVLVTGHTFGIRAYEGVFSSPSYLDGRIEVPLMVGLPAGRAAGTVGYAPISGLADAQGIEHVEADDATLHAHAEQLARIRPHYLLVVGWSRLVHPDVLTLPTEGCLGMHPTKLPLGRGQAPIPWTIIKGLSSTSLSVFGLEAQADTGPLVAQYDLAVHPRETATSLFYRMAALHFTAGRDLAGQLGRRRIEARPQRAGESTRWPRRRPADGRIEHSMSAVEIDRLVRALLEPYPRAFVSIDGADLPVVAAQPAPERPGEGPEHEEVAAGVVRFGCRDGVVRLRTRAGG